MQAQVWSTAGSVALTSPCSTPRHPNHALLSGYISKGNRKVCPSLETWHKNDFHECVYFGDFFWEVSACAGLHGGSQSHQFSLPLFLLHASGSLLPAKEPGTPAPARPHSALGLLTLCFHTNHPIGTIPDLNLVLAVPLSRRINTGTGFVPVSSYTL